MSRKKATAASSSSSSASTPNEGKRRAATLNDAKSLVSQSAAIEELAQDVLSRRRAMVDLDAKRQKNTEALAMFRPSRAKSVGGGAPIGDKAWAHTGSLFIKMPRQMLYDTIVADQTALTAAIDEHRNAIKKSLAQLHSLRALTVTGSSITSAQSSRQSSSFSSEEFGDDSMDSTSVALILRSIESDMEQEAKQEHARRAIEAAEQKSAAAEEHQLKRDADSRAKQRNILAETLGTKANTASSSSSTTNNNTSSNKAKR